MTYHLICVHPFGRYSKGQAVTDPAEVKTLSADRDHHFVRVPAPPVEASETPPAADEPEQRWNPE